MKKFSFVRNKKGMSPLLVTIFLAALAVSLGAMIMSWGSSIGGMDSSTCDDVRISVQEVSGEEMFCFDESKGTLRAIIVNSGDVAISGLIQRRIGTDFEVREIFLDNTRLEVGQVYRLDWVLEPGRVRLELIPYIFVLNEQVKCSSKSIIREEIKKC